MKKLLYAGLFCASMAWAAGCNDQKEDKKEEEDDIIVEPVDCTTLDVTACEAEKECVVLSADHVDEERVCKISHEKVGCMNGDTACDEAMTWARDPDGGLWYFSNGCLPTGWTYAHDIDFSEPYEGQECTITIDPVACHAQDEAACATRDDCEGYYARRVHTDDDCADEATFVACGDKQDVCADQSTMGKDADDDLWIFPTRCLPDAWEADRSEAAEAYLDAEFCEP